MSADKTPEPKTSASVVSPTVPHTKANVLLDDARHRHWLTYPSFLFRLKFLVRWICLANREFSCQSSDIVNGGRL